MGYLNPSSKPIRKKTASSWAWIGGLLGEHVHRKNPSKKDRSQSKDREKTWKDCRIKLKIWGVGPTVKKRGREEELDSQPTLRTTKKLNIDHQEERQEWEKHFRLFLPPKTKGQ